MAMYYCGECDSYFDNDYFPLTNFPEDSANMICPSCLERLHEEENPDDE